ncbi:DNA polymerase subunit Cdc27 [Phlyctochytrium arcticum]|nr:DNA polymerase subunit Cdc27 [Phlyctochytrium arcticum]
MSDPITVLKTALQQEKRVVTYKWVSRKLSVDVNSAKQILYQYYATEKSEPIFATYYIQGRLGDGRDVLCQVVDEERLEEAKKQYKSCSVHVYSLQPCKPKDENTLFAVDFEVAQNDTFESMKACRLVRHGSVALLELKARKQALAASKSTSAATSNAPALSTSNKPISDPSAPREKSPATTKSTTSTPNSKSSFFKEQAKQATEKAKQTKTPSKSSAAKSKKAKTPTTKKAREDAERQALREEQEAALNRLLDSDDEGEKDEEAMRMRELAEQAEETQSQPQDSPIVISDAMELDETDSAGQDPLDQSNGNEARPRVKRRRRVKKTRTVKVGKYMKTEDYSDWEEYSEEEPERSTTMSHPAAAKKQKQDVSAPGAGGANAAGAPTKGGASKGAAKGKKAGAAAGQKSLLSFFGKK